MPNKTYSFPPHMDPNRHEEHIETMLAQAMGIDLAKQESETRSILINMGGQRSGKTLAMLEEQNFEQAKMIAKLHVENKELEVVIQGMQVQLADLNAACKSYGSALNKRDAEIKRLKEVPKPHHYTRPGRNIIV